jgi:hypothetical protein
MESDPRTFSNPEFEYEWVFHRINEAIKTLKEIEKEFPPVSSDSALRKAARKLAWIHQQIDLYDDRPDTHEEDYWMDYLTDPEWDDQDIDWYSGKDKK